MKPQPATRRGQKSTAQVADVLLGRAIRKRRRELGLSQSVVAEAVGVSFQQFQKYETGHNRISFSRLVQIAAALRCPVVDLVAAAENVEGREGASIHELQGAEAAELMEMYGQLGHESRAAMLQFLRAIAKMSASSPTTLCA